MVTYASGTFLGITENNYSKGGVEYVMRHLIVLDDVNTLKFTLNDDVYNKIKEFKLTRLSNVKLAFNLYSKATVNSNGYAIEVVNVQLVDIEPIKSNK